MSGELEAAGALATAGLAAGAIEGREPGAHGEACANCGAVLSGPYCSQCGQHGHPHRSLLHMVEEFLHGILHFDTKAWRTLPMLLVRPGTLTRQYVYGRRARYISPLALFLFTVFSTFFAFALGAGPGVNLNRPLAEEREMVGADLAEAREELAGAQAELARVLANPDPNEPAGLEERLARMDVRLAEESIARSEAELARIDAAQTEAAVPPAEAPAKSEAGADNTPAGVRVGVFVNEQAGGRDAGSSELRWQDEVREAAENGEIEVNLGSEYLNERARHTLLNPDLALYKVEQALYKFSFLLVPISLPFLALLFLWKRGVTLYDHVVFILYSLSFMSLLFLVGSLVGRIPGGWGAGVAGTLLALPPVHMFFQLKGAYALGWFSATWRTLLLLVMAQICLAIFVLIILIVGLAG